MSEGFIVDWQDTEEVVAADKPVGSVVSVLMEGRKAGLYRVLQVMREGMLLAHGAISFPVGTRLDIDGAWHSISGGLRSVQVVANDPHGVQLAW
jgi:hypothetical protein